MMTLRYLILGVLRHRLAVPAVCAALGVFFVVAVSVEPALSGALHTAAHLALALATGAALYAVFVRLVKTEQRYRVLVRSMHDLVLFVAADGNILDANPAAVRAYGWTRSQILGSPYDRLCAEDAAGAFAVQSILAGSAALSAQGEHRRKDGSSFPVEISATKGEIGREAVVVIVVRDITGRRRREDFERLLHEIDRKTLSGAGLDSILAFVADRLSLLYASSLVQIALKADDGSVRIRQFAGKGRAFLDGIVVRWDDTPEGRGPTGTAIRAAEIQFSKLEHDDGFLPWREKALQEGFRFAVALPLVAQGTVLGALTMFTPPGVLDEAGIEALRGFADQVAISVHSAQTHDQLVLQRVALESAANAIVISDGDGVMRWVNPAFTILTGYTFEEAVGQTPRILKSGQQGDAFYREMWSTLKAGRVWQGELYNRRKDGSRYIEEQTITPVREAGGAITHFVAIKLDITSRKRQEERIQYLAMHDALTGLPNRRLLAENLSRAVHQATRGRHGALMIIDIDSFKLVNDSYGHAAGDHLLKELAERISRSLRPGDLVARIGGDEFAVLVEGVEMADAVQTARRFHAEMEAFQFSIGDHCVAVGTSIGIAAIDGTIDGDAVTVHADSALYSAKELGRNRVVAYDPESDWSSRLMEAGQWAARIREALRGEGFELFYQPIVNLTTGRADHYEVLLRLRGDDGLFITAERFLRAAERFGLMPQIDRWVIEKVTEVLGRTQNLAVFVNLAAASLADESLLDLIAERLGVHDITPGRLAFEITETAAITDIAKAQNWIRRVKDLGCRFALDDFGIGFSSLAYLRALSVDYVKIDRSFVADVHVDETSRALVQAVSTVALSLGKEVIAEGVECAEHASVLREIGIDRGQGYFWGVPSALSSVRETFDIGQDDLAPEAVSESDEPAGCTQAFASLSDPQWSDARSSCDEQS
jgi:diguanylate cyclase (GGDEF)-like protein/PAS domain S-box-containing protein